MSGQLRTLKNRIRSISSTKKITRAMEMVSASKLKRYQKMVLDGSAYAEGLLNLLKRVSAAGGSAGHPLLEKRPVNNKALLLFTSDTGLCGSFNQDLLSAAHRYFKSEKEQPLVIGVGKIGVQALKRTGTSFAKTFVETKTAEIESTILEINRTALDLFMSGRADAIDVIYNRFINATKYEAVTERLLPFSIDVSEASSSEESYLIEPDAATLFDRLVPAVFSMRVRRIFLESFVSEQMARMNAMHQATENASELIDELVLERNKARQAAITKELIEIISGSQALKA